MLSAQTNDTIHDHSCDSVEVVKSAPQSIYIEDNCQSIMSIKKEFIKKYLQLTETEAKQFWPIYNEYLRQESLIYDKYRFELEKRKIKTQNGKVWVNDDTIYYQPDVFCFLQVDDHVEAVSSDEALPAAVGVGPTATQTVGQRGCSSSRVVGVEGIYE
jgi:hypothetical protein